MKLLVLAFGSSFVFLLAASPAIAQCSDAYEPDDSVFGTTALIKDGETQHRNFCDNSVDWVGFVACGGRAYTIQTSNLGELADTYLEVYASNGGTVLASNDDGNGGLASRIVWTAPSSGLYHAKVHQTDNTHGLYREYDLFLKGPTTSCDLWNYSTGGSQWDQVDGLVQRRDGTVLAAGRTDTAFPSPSPSILVVALNMDGSSTVKGAPNQSVVVHAMVRDSSGNILGVGETNLLSGGNTWDSAVISLGYDASSQDYGKAMLIIGGNSDDYSNAIAIVGDGSWVVAGSTASGGAGGLDALLYLHGSYYGAPNTWQKTIGGSGNEELYSVLANANGDITVSGYTTSYGAGQKDGLVARLNSSGNMIWSRVIGGTGNDEFRKVFETADGGLLLIGTTTGSPSVAAADIWFVRLDGQGQVLWEKTIGGGGDDRILGATAVSDGYVLAGYSDSAAIGNYDGLLMKVDATGNPGWIRAFGGSGTDRLYGVIQTIDGALVAAGYSKSFSVGLADAWILKTTIDGESSATCESTSPPQMVGQSRASAITDSALSAVDMIGTNYWSNGYYLVNTGFYGNLECHILSPSEVSGPGTFAPLMFASRDNFVWEDGTANHADSFNLYRGDISGLPLGDSGSCLGTIPTNAYTDPDEPAYGNGWFYLVTGRNALGEGSMGKNSLGQDRTNTFPCP